VFCARVRDLSWRNHSQKSCALHRGVASKGNVRTYLWAPLRTADMPLTVQNWSCRMHMALNGIAPLSTEYALRFLCRGLKHIFHLERNGVLQLDLEFWHSLGAAFGAYHPLHSKPSHVQDRLHAQRDGVHLAFVVQRRRAENNMGRRVQHVPAAVQQFGTRPACTSTSATDYRRRPRHCTFKDANKCACGFTPHMVLDVLPIHHMTPATTSMSYSSAATHTCGPRALPG
jgi:hypothetical protein